MTCAEARELLWEVAGGELDGARADDVRDHARACDACGAELVELSATVSLARRVGTEPLPEGFSLELHHKLVAAEQPPQRAGLLARLRELFARPAIASFAAAALAGLVVAVGMNVHSGRHPSAYRVPETKVALVKIDFVAEKAVDDVDFEVTLPDGLRFFSGGQQLAERSFRWQGKLQQGSNPIPIAVKGPRAGRYRVVAHAIGPGLDVTQEVWLEVTT